MKRKKDEYLLRSRCRIDYPDSKVTTKSSEDSEVLDSFHKGTGKVFLRKFEIQKEGKVLDDSWS